MVANAAVIGENAKRARDANGFSQANVAEFLNVDQSFIARFEKGSRSLQSDMLERLANLYGCKASAFGCKDGLRDQKIKTAYRSSGISASDMEVIHDIKRIALNLLFMTELAGSDSYER